MRIDSFAGVKFRKLRKKLHSLPKALAPRVGLTLDGIRLVFFCPDVPRTQLDALEERGYLDPDKRGERAAEIEAVECYLGEYADPAGLSLDVARVCD